MTQEVASERPAPRARRETRTTRQPRALPASVLRRAVSSWRKRHKDEWLSSLLTDIEQMLDGLSWITWQTVDSLHSSIALAKVLEAIDVRVTQALRAAEMQLGNAQVATLKVLGHPAGPLARGVLEQHRMMISIWSQNRGLDFSGDGFHKWRGFLAKGVKLHNQTIEYVGRSVASHPRQAESTLNSTALAAMSAITPLLLNGSIGKDLAVEFVGLIVDFVEGCHFIENCDLSTRPAWIHVRDTIKEHASALPMHELPLLFPARLNEQSHSIDEQSKAIVSRRSLVDGRALLIAHDYKRLAAQLCYPPWLLDGVDSTEVEMAVKLRASYVNVQATLMVGAELLRSMSTWLLTADAHASVGDTLHEDATNNFSNQGEVSSERILKEQLFSNPAFCEVCSRSVGIRKYCSLHVNTGGQANKINKRAREVAPSYKDALLRLHRFVHDPVNAGDSFMSTAFDVGVTQPNTIETLQKRLPDLLGDILNRASWGLPVESGQAVRQLQTAVSDVQGKMVSAISGRSVQIWPAVVLGALDLVALGHEVDRLCRSLDLLNDVGGQNLDPQKLLSFELKLFAATYSADLLCRAATICNSPDPGVAALLPENIRDDFYKRWFTGYEPMFSLGHASAFEAHDLDFVEKPSRQFAFDSDRLWDRQTDLYPPSLIS